MPADFPSEASVVKGVVFPTGLVQKLDGPGHALALLNHVRVLEWVSRNMADATDDDMSAVGV